MPRNEGLDFRAERIQDDERNRVGFRTILHCHKCGRKRGHELRPFTPSGGATKGTLEDFKFRCTVCGTPSDKPITIATGTGLSDPL